jgi:hypothetical protein
MSHRRIALVLGIACAGLVARARAQETKWFAQGTSPEQIGSSLAFVGDVDGDGISDLLAGGVGFNSSQSLVRLLSGANGSTIRTDVLNDTFAKVAALGDVDGDGVPDLLIGITTHVENGKYTGMVLVHSGATGVELQRLFGDNDYDFLGSSVGGLGDVDGDGVPDFFAGASCYANGKAGYARVFSGATGAKLYDVKGTATGERFGISGASLSDLDGDGVRDFVVGALHVSSNPGYLRIVSGASGATLRTIVAPANSPNFGVIAADAGDVDGDGSDDVITLDDQYSTGFLQQFGAAFVFSGATGTEIRRHVGTQAEPLMLTAAGAGDVDGDGFADYAVSTFIYDIAGGNPFDTIGQARLYSGKTGLSLYRFRPAGLNSFFGYALAGGADLDGDGRSELAVGAPSGGTGGGRVDVFRGNDLYLDAEPDVALAGDTVALTTRVGVPGNVTIDALIDVNGTPTFVLLDGLATFDATGTHALSGTVPAGLAGTTFTFFAAAIDASGHVVRSATESLAFQ